MDAMTVQTVQNNLIRRVLEVQDMNLLKKAMKLLSHTEDEETVNTVSEEMAPYKTKAEVLADWEEVCDTIKSAREGKIKGRPVEELLNEL